MGCDFPSLRFASLLDTLVGIGRFPYPYTGAQTLKGTMCNGMVWRRMRCTFYAGEIAYVDRFQHLPMKRPLDILCHTLSKCVAIESIGIGVGEEIYFLSWVK